MFIMKPKEWHTLSAWLTMGAAASILVSIAVSEILLGMAFTALLLSRQSVRFPPIKLPFFLFVMGTLLSLGVSGHVLEGWPQVKKFFVFLIIPAVYNTLRQAQRIYMLVFLWVSIGTVAALLSIGQFGMRVRQAHQLGQDFYAFYISQRTTGFMGHWMTFSGEQMIVFLILLAFMLFSPWRVNRIWYFVAAGLLLTSLLISFTRTAWLGMLMGVIYLFWQWRARMLMVVALALIVGFYLAPGAFRARITSFVKPLDEVDSNSHRLYAFRVGLEMIKAHPVFGLGPQQVGRQFDNYIPRDLPSKKPVGWYGHLHNIYLQYAAERGIPTLVFLLWIIGKMLFDFYRALYPAQATARADRPMLQGAIAVILSVLVAGLFEYNMGDSEVLLLFLAVVACGYVALEGWDQGHGSAVHKIPEGVFVQRSP